jgi:hypothetical protein
MTIVRFVPDDKNLLNQIFTAMNECQALYPDEDMSGDEDERDEEEGDCEENEYGDEFGEGEFVDISSDPNIQLSDRGQEVLRRININYQTQGKLKICII